MITVAVDALADFAAALLTAQGVPQDQAARAARLILEADLLGGEGHGIFRLPRYLERLEAGGVNPRPDIREVRRKGGVALIDGDNGLGHLVMDHAAGLAVELAREHGVAWVGVRRSNHAGAGGIHAMVPARAGMVGLYMAVGSANHMAPWGGIDLLLSTNPIAIAIPAEGGPLLLDMATTVASYGKVKLAADRGEAMPEGWMIDAEGRPLTDPTRAAGGSLLPIGGAKGYGLALMVGLLAGTLNGAAFGREVVDYNADATTETNTGHAIVALDPAALGDPSSLTEAVAAHRDQMRTARPRPGFDRIRTPGERSLGEREARLARGIALPPRIAAALAARAATAGIPFPWGS